MELTIRHLKTTMGMEQLRCKSPEMARKELLAYLVAYNLIHCLMAEAVIEDSPFDSFWGLGPTGQGENHLGKLLMELRGELQMESAESCP